MQISATVGFFFIRTSLNTYLDMQQRAYSIVR